MADTSLVARPDMWVRCDGTVAVFQELSADFAPHQNRSPNPPIAVLGDPFENWAIRLIYDPRSVRFSDSVCVPVIGCHPKQIREIPS